MKNSKLLIRSIAVLLVFLSLMQVLPLSIVASSLEKQRDIMDGNEFELPVSIDEVGDNYVDSDEIYEEPEILGEIILLRTQTVDNSCRSFYRNAARKNLERRQPSCGF